jgi:hypothetical protein
VDSGSGPDIFSKSNWGDGLGKNEGNSRKLPGLVHLCTSLVTSVVSGRPVTNAVVTVPAYFNDAQRQATKVCFSLFSSVILLFRMLVRLPG